jgi:hypothetical protein
MKTLVGFSSVSFWVDTPVLGYFFCCQRERLFNQQKDENRNENRAEEVFGEAQKLEDEDTNMNLVCDQTNNPTTCDASKFVGSSAWKLYIITG